MSLLRPGVIKQYKPNQTLYIDTVIKSFVFTVLQKFPKSQSLSIQYFPQPFQMEKMMMKNKISNDTLYHKKQH